MLRWRYESGCAGCDGDPAAADLLADKNADADAWLAKIKAVNPGYGEGYAIVAHHLELHYRYEDAMAYYRKAMEADPELWSAHSQLGINLMRMGQEEEPQRAAGAELQQRAIAMRLR